MARGGAHEGRGRKARGASQPRGQGGRPGPLTRQVPGPGRVPGFSEGPRVGWKESVGWVPTGFRKPPDGSMGSTVVVGWLIHEGGHWVMGAAVTGWGQGQVNAVSNAMAERGTTTPSNAPVQRSPPPTASTPDRASVAFLPVLRFVFTDLR